MRPESDFTPPSGWCQHPEWWTAEDAMATEQEVIELVAAFVRALQPELVVETGTYRGYAAAAIGAALAANGHGRLLTVERDPVLAAEAREAVTLFPVTVVEADTAHWDPPAGAGLLWLDSSTDGRSGELRRWLPSLAPGAVALVHDTGPQHAAGHGLRVLEAQGMITMVSLRSPRGVSVCQATGLVSGSG